MDKITFIKEDICNRVDRATPTKNRNTEEKTISEMTDQAALILDVLYYLNLPPLERTLQKDKEDGIQNLASRVIHYQDCCLL